MHRNEYLIHRITINDVTHYVTSPGNGRLLLYCEDELRTFVPENMVERGSVGSTTITCLRCISELDAIWQRLKTRL